MSTLLAVPVIEPQFARQCLDTIDPALHRQLLVIDNCRWPLNWHPRHATIHRARHNLGVARSWNLAVVHARQTGHDAVALFSSSVRFGEAAANDLAAVDPGEWGVLQAPAYWHTAVFSLALFDRIGIFDESFFPAYYEDCDFHRRWLLARIDIPMRTESLDLHVERDGHGVDALRREHSGSATINLDALADYWQKKWGCHVDDREDLTRGHRTPFGDPAKPLSWWEPATVEDLLGRYGIVGR